MNFAISFTCNQLMKIENFFLDCSWNFVCLSNTSWKISWFVLYDWLTNWASISHDLLRNFVIFLNEQLKKIAISSLVIKGLTLQFFLLIEWWIFVKMRICSAMKSIVLRCILHFLRIFCFGVSYCYNKRKRIHLVIFLKTH